MKNNWQSIWNNRKSSLEGVNPEDETQIILELKRIVGWDCQVHGLGVMFGEFKKEYEYLKNNLKLAAPDDLEFYDKTVFEVGCGSGAYLYFFKKDGFKVGGIDYSENLINIARAVVGDKNLIECICDEATNLPIDVKYNSVFAAGVFQYFDSLEYVEKVLDEMILKTKRSIGILRILDEKSKENYLEFHRNLDPNYDEKYKDTPHLFISKDFFISYAKNHDLGYKFDQCHMENFWNEPYIFDCFLYKR